MLYIQIQTINYFNYLGNSIIKKYHENSRQI